MNNKRYVLITTDKDKRGVFCGYLEEDKGETVELSEARMILYWSEETMGVIGIAAKGCQKGSRVSSAAPRIKLYGVTSITDFSPEAQKVMEEEKWK